mmetsp:Transcript_22709/g.45907  ORF Transcript_22709/g.45907 Transcript_22709/m.45907 type:complete len:498 (+) Transcript_22709:283-1776(+)
MFIDAAGERDLLSNLGADGDGELDLGEVSLDSAHVAARRRAPHVHHQNLPLRQLLHLLALLISLGLDAEETAQKEEVDLEVRVDVRQLPRLSQHLADEAVSAGEGGVDLGADADEAAWHGVLELVVFGEERHNAREDGCAHHLALRVLLHNPRADLNLRVTLEHTAQDRASRHAPAQVHHLLAGLVDVEGADDDHARVRGEVAHRHRDHLCHVLGDDVDVVAELGGDGDDGGLLGDSALDERFDGLVLLQRRLLLHQVDLVLENDDVLQLHDLNSGQMLRRLRLRAELVARHQQQRGVHDSRTVEHGGHENVMAWTIDKRHMAQQLPLALIAQLVGGARAGLDLVLALGVSRLAGGQDDALLVVEEGGRAERTEVSRALLRRVDASIKLGIGIAELDGDITLELVLEAHCHDPRERLNNRRLPVCHVPNRPDIDRCLSADHFRRQRGERCRVKGCEILHQQPTGDFLLLVVLVFGLFGTSGHSGIWFFLHLSHFAVR